MSYGLEIYNENQVLQITQDYMNLALFSKAELTSFTALNDNEKQLWIRLIPCNLYSYSLTVPSNVTNPVTSITANSYGICVLSAIQTGNTLKVIVFVPGGASLVGLNLYVFGTGATSSGSYGLRVFTADGRVAFDSNQVYMRVSTVLPYTLDASVNIDTGRVYACATNSWWYEWGYLRVTTPGTGSEGGLVISQWREWVLAPKYSGGSFVMNRFTGASSTREYVEDWWNYPAVDYTRTATPPFTMILDVTNY